MSWLYKKVSLLIKEYRKKFPDLSLKLDSMKDKLKRLPVILIASKCDKFIKKKQTSISDLVKGVNSGKEFAEKVFPLSRIIEETFDFGDNGNLLFLSLESSKTDLELFFYFIEQIFIYKTNTSLDLDGNSIFSYNRGFRFIDYPIDRRRIKGGYTSLV